MRKDRVTIRVTKNNPDLLNDLTNLSEVMNMSVNKLIVFILSNHLRKLKRKNNDRIK